MYFNFSIFYSRSYALLLVGCQISLYGPTRSWTCPSSFCGWWYQDWKSWWQIYQDVNIVWELYLMKSNISNLDYLLLKNCQTRKWHEFNKWLLWWHILLIWLHFCFNKEKLYKKNVYSFCNCHCQQWCCQLHAYFSYHLALIMTYRFEF